MPEVDGIELLRRLKERGTELPDPDGLLTGSGKQVRMLVFARAEDVDEDVIDRYLDVAIEVGAALRRR